MGPKGKTMLRQLIGQRVSGADSLCKPLGRINCGRFSTEVPWGAPGGAVTVCQLIGVVIGVL